jgi:hypothetical protein
LNRRILIKLKIFKKNKKKYFSIFNIVIKYFYKYIFIIYLILGEFLTNKKMDLKYTKIIEAINSLKLNIENFDEIERVKSQYEEFIENLTGFKLYKIQD